MQWSQMQTLTTQLAKQTQRQTPPSYIQVHSYLFAKSSRSTFRNDSIADDHERLRSSRHVPSEKIIYPAPWGHCSRLHPGAEGTERDHELMALPMKKMPHDERCVHHKALCSKHE